MEEQDIDWDGSQFLIDEAQLLDLEVCYLADCF